MKSEVWRGIKGHPDIQISTLGNISLGDHHITPGRITSRGYRTVTLTKAGVRINHRVHQLVMKAFVGPCPNRHEINHKNGIKSDNRLCNLEYVTRSENIKHAYRLGLQKPRKGSLNGRSKLTERDALAILCLYSHGFDQSYMGRVFGVTSAAVRLICIGKSWPHVKADFEKLEGGEVIRTWAALERHTGFDRTTIYRWIKLYGFPEPKRSSPKAAGTWGILQVDNWMFANKALVDICRNHNGRKAKQHASI